MSLFLILGGNHSYLQRRLDKGQIYVQLTVLQVGVLRVVRDVEAGGAAALSSGCKRLRSAAAVQAREASSLSVGGTDCLRSADASAETEEGKCVHVHSPSLENHSERGRPSLEIRNFSFEREIYHARKTATNKNSETCFLKQTSMFLLSCL